MLRSSGCIDSRSLAGRRSACCIQRRSIASPFFHRQYVAARPVKLHSIGGGDQGPQQQYPVVPAAPLEDAAAAVAAPGLAPAYPAPVYPEGIAMYAAGPEGTMRSPYAQAPPQYYTNAPPPYPVHPMYMPQPQQPVSNGLPWWLLVGGGVLLGSMLGKLQELVKKGPQQMMAEMAMKQMMGSMGAPGQTPPGFPGGANPFGGFPPPPSGFGPPPSGFGAPPSGFGASSATVDATATQVPPQTSTKPSESSRPGDKFNQRLGGSAGSSSSTTNGRFTDQMPVVEATTVAEPPSSSSRKGDNGASSSARSAFFTDVNVEEAKAKAFSGGAAQQASQDSSTTGADGTDNMAELLEQMLRNPNMQKMLYPYLPENMRNPTSIEWMLSNPEVKKSMAQMFAQQNISPQMLSMMKNMDFNQDKVDQQFKELGMKPEDVMSKVMANPELAAGFSNPKVQAAIMDISSNPMNITKYAGDPEIMKVLNEVQALFQSDVPPQYR